MRGGRRGGLGAVTLAAVVATAVLAPTSAGGAPAAVAPAARPLVVMTGNGQVSLIDSSTGAVLEKLGHFANQVDPGLAYSVSRQGVFFLQLQKHHEELVEVSTVTKQLTNVVGAIAFALSPNGKRVAYVTANGRALAVRQLSSARTTRWSPGPALSRTETLGAIGWLNDTTALVQPQPDGVATTGTRADATAAVQPWFRIALADHQLTGRSLTPPTVVGDVATLSHDSAQPGHAFAMSDRSPTDVLRLAVTATTVQATLVARVTVTVALAVSPSGRRLAFVANHERAGADHIDLEVCGISPAGTCRPVLLQPDAQLGQVAWATG